MVWLWVRVLRGGPIVVREANQHNSNLFAAWRLLPRQPQRGLRHDGLHVVAHIKIGTQETPHVSQSAYSYF